MTTLAEWRARASLAVQLYRYGLPVDDIAQVIDAAPSTVRRRLRQAGVALRREHRGGRALLPVDLDALVHLHSEGRPDPAIAAALGVSTSVVRDRRRALGLAPIVAAGRPFGGALDDDLRRLNAQGWSDKRIAAEMGQTPETITQRRRILGLSPGVGAPVADTSRDNEIRRFHGAGRRDHEIAAALGGDWTRGRVARARVRLGLPGLPPPGRRPHSDDEIRRLYAAGLVDREIGAVLGRTPESVSKSRRRLGLPGHRSHPRSRPRPALVRI